MNCNRVGCSVVWVLDIHTHKYVDNYSSKYPLLYNTLVS